MHDRLTQTHTPSTRRPSGDFRFKLNRQTQETVEPIKGDMSNMAHVSWRAYVHDGGDGSAGKEGFPEKGQQKGEEREVWSEKGIARE